MESKSWEKMGRIILWVEVKRSCFPHEHWKKCFLKDNEKRQTLAYKEMGMTKDGR